MSEVSALQQRLAGVVSRVRGEESVVSGLERLTGGASSETWRFQVAAGPRREVLILRRGAQDADFSLSKAQEVEALTAARRAGVPVPEVVAALTPDDALGEGYIMACIEGETLPPKILRDPALETARQRLTAQCGEALAAIHAISPSDVPSLPVHSADEQLQTYQHLYRQYDEPLPVFDLAFAWLSERIPEAARTSLVHGDFRNGNLIVDGTGLRAVLDWELAYVGDPMADLGWLCVNSWRFGRSELPVGGFGQRDELYCAYEQHSGCRVDPTAVFFWELFGVLKWGLICLHQCQRHLSGSERSVELAAIGRRVSECELDIVNMLKREVPDGQAR